MNYALRNTTKFDNERYLKVLVTSSLGLQILLYFVAPWRKRCISRPVQGLISIIFLLSNWIPALTLILITSCVVFSYGGVTTAHESPLLTWASLMLLHLAGHGQERETPLSIQPGEIGKETYKLILEFLFYSMIFLVAFLFDFESWNDETLPETLGFALLACFKTFGKLKNLRDRCNEIKHELSKTSFQSHTCETGQAKNVTIDVTHASYFFERSWRLILGGLINLENTCKHTYSHLNPMKACEIVEAEQKLIYYKFYRGIVPSESELLITTVLLSVELSSSPLFIATIFINSYVILYATVFIMGKLYVPLLKVVKETEIPLLSTASSVLPPLSKTLYTSSLESSNMLVYILLITHHLVAYPIMLKTHYFNRVYRNDPHQWPNWSRTILKFNILTYSLRKPSKISTSIHHMLNTWPISGKEQYKEVGEFIFRELRDIIVFHQSDDSNHKQNVARQITAAKGLFVIRQANHKDLVDCEAPFQERVLLWHVASNILYHTSSSNTQTFSNMSMLLSDYMGYLLIVQPLIMSKQRGAVLRRCLEMWAEIDELTQDCDIQDDETICQKIFLNQQSSEEGKAKTVLQGANDLAKKLKSTFPDENQRWRFIFKVWVEKLAYASTHCDTIDHVQGLTQGGELASIVWLRMLHFQSMPTTLTIKSSKPDPWMMRAHAIMKKSRPSRKKYSRTPKALRRKQYHHNYPSILFFKCITFLNQQVHNSPVLFSKCITFLNQQISLKNITILLQHVLIYFIICIILLGSTSTFLTFVFSHTPYFLINVGQIDALK